MIIVTFFFLSKQHIFDHVSIYFNCCFHVFFLVECDDIISLIQIVKLYFYKLYFNKFTTNPCKAWVKISKVMPQPKSISPGKGREALRQKVQILRLNMVRLNHTYYSLLKFHKQNCSKFGSFGQNSSKLSKIRSIRLYTPRIAQNLHRLLTCLYYVSGTCPSREPCRIPANYANSA